MTESQHLQDLLLGSSTVQKNTAVGSSYSWVINVSGLDLQMEATRIGGKEGISLLRNTRIEVEASMRKREVTNFLEVFNDPTAGQGFGFSDLGASSALASPNA